VILAFEVANPKYEEAADADKAAAVVEPLPACFQNLLEKKILVNAKRDELAKMKTYIEKERCVTTADAKQAFIKNQHVVFLFTDQQVCPRRLAAPSSGLPCLCMPLTLSPEGYPCALAPLRPCTLARTRPHPPIGDTRLLRRS
jgi:hypothetical protein